MFIMKNRITILVLALLWSSRGYTQGLYIAPTSNVHINSGTTFFCDSLAFIPIGDFNITGTNAQVKNNTVVNTTAVPYINRVYKYANTTAPYSGAIIVYYKDIELNSIPENLLTLNIHNGTQWNNYNMGVSRDPINNIVATYSLNNVNLNEITLANELIPLPINLIDFKTKCVNGLPVLNWQTAQEQNIKQFIVQKSTDAQSWQTIDSVVAIGNSNIIQNYTYNDNSASNNSYYRILMVNINGQFTVSKIVRNNCTNNLLFAVYPNPVKDIATVNIYTNVATPLNLYLYDGKGALVKAIRSNLLVGNNQLLIPMQQFAQGWYTLTAQFNNEVKQVTLIKE
jgi:hypothetical protein